MADAGEAMDVCLVGEPTCPSRMGEMMKEYSTAERIMAVIQSHPISFTVATLVIGFQVYRFISERNWQEG